MYMIIIDEPLFFLFVFIPCDFRSTFCFTQKMYWIWVDSFVTYCLTLTPKLTDLQQQQYIIPRNMLGLGTSAYFVWLIHIAAFISRVSGAVRSKMTSLTFLEVDASCWL